MASSVFIGLPNATYSGGTLTLNGVLSISSSAVTSGVPILGPDGSAAAPSYSFASDPNTGWFSSGPDSMGLAVGGTIRHEFTTGGHYLYNDAAAIIFGAASDVSLSRGAADVLQLANGDTFKHGTGTAGFGSTATTGTLVTNDAQTVLDAGIVPLGSDSVSVMLFVTDNGSRNAIFSLDGTNRIAFEVSDPAGTFSATAGTASSVNIYWSAANLRYELQNLRGSTRSIRIVRIGL